MSRSKPKHYDAAQESGRHHNALDYDHDKYHGCIYKFSVASFGRRLENGYPVSYVDQLANPRRTHDRTSHNATPTVGL